MAKNIKKKKCLQFLGRFLEKIHNVSQVIEIYYFLTPHLLPHFLFSLLPISDYGISRTNRPVARDAKQDKLFSATHTVDAPSIAN